MFFLRTHWVFPYSFPSVIPIYSSEMKALQKLHVHYRFPFVCCIKNITVSLQVSHNMPDWFNFSSQKSSQQNHRWEFRGRHLWTINPLFFVLQFFHIRPGRLQQACLTAYARTRYECLASGLLSPDHTETCVHTRYTIPSLTDTLSKLTSTILDTISERLWRTQFRHFSRPRQFHDNFVLLLFLSG